MVPDDAFWPITCHYFTYILCLEVMDPFQPRALWHQRNDVTFFPVVNNFTGQNRANELVPDDAFLTNNNTSYLIPIYHEVLYALAWPDTTDNKSIHTNAVCYNFFWKCTIIWISTSEANNTISYGDIRHFRSNFSNTPSELRTWTIINYNVTVLKLQNMHKLMH